MRPSNLITGTEHRATKLFPESKTAADEAQNKVKKLQSSLDHANAIVETVKSENQVWSTTIYFSDFSFCLQCTTSCWNEWKILLIFSPLRGSC